jgi:hypothetical protein
MAGINQMITLGIGVPSDIPHLVLTGLGPEGDTPIPPGNEGAPPESIPTGVPTTILADATIVPTTGSIFALPAGGTRLTWQTIVAVIPVALEVLLQISHNGFDWAILDTSNNINGEVRSLRVNSRFIRAILSDVSDVDPVNVTVIVLIRREKI